MEAGMLKRGGCCLCKGLDDTCVRDSLYFTPPALIRLARTPLKGFIKLFLCITFHISLTHSPLIRYSTFPALTSPPRRSRTPSSHHESRLMYSSGLIRNALFPVPRKYVKQMFH
ncbi:hypothetical protein E2C01_080737 [Portunus trituberculatus]|uniref:Uncharacterized protein n=1 Tax=Portunus trituberculatus TaxID=210409 RepID=A0A5B7IKE5_PORTR|nr:hypothetical protein [Portunus trituberculatus]